jgi:hypothetical protein
MTMIMTGSRQSAGKDRRDIIMKVDSGGLDQTFDVAASLHHRNAGHRPLP